MLTAIKLRGPHMTIGICLWGSLAVYSKRKNKTFMSEENCFNVYSFPEKNPGVDIVHFTLLFPLCPPLSSNLKPKQFCCVSRNFLVSFQECVQPHSQTVTI